MSNKFYLVAIICLIAIFAMSPPLYAGTQIGDALPQLTLPDLNGLPVTIQPNGQPLVLNFWRLGCDYCHQENSDLMKFANDYNKTVTFYSIDVADNADNVIAYFQQNGLFFKQTLLMNADRKIWKQMQSQGVPLTLITDKDGIIRWRILGPLSYAELENYVADADQYQ